MAIFVISLQLGKANSNPISSSSSSSSSSRQSYLLAQENPIFMPSFVHSLDWSGVPAFKVSWCEGGWYEWSFLCFPETNCNKLRYRCLGRHNRCVCDWANCSHDCGSRILGSSFGLSHFLCVSKSHRLPSISYNNNNNNNNNIVIIIIIITNDINSYNMQILSHVQ